MGHSCLLYHRELATIKRHINKFDRIYSVDEKIKEHCYWKQQLQQVFSIKVIQTKDILDFKSFWKTYFRKSFISQETCSKSLPKANKIRFEITNYIQVSFYKEKFGRIFAVKPLTVQWHIHLKCSKTSNKNRSYHHLQLMKLTKFRSREQKSMTLGAFCHILLMRIKSFMIMNWPAFDQIETKANDEWLVIFN